MQYLKGQSDIALQGTAGELNKAKTQEANINNQLLGVNLSKSQMMLGAVHHLYGITDKLPPGPQKAQAVQTANGVKQAVANEIQQNNANTAAQVSANSEAAYNQRKQEMKDLGTFGGKDYSSMTDRAKDMEEHQIPSVGTSSTQLTPDDRKGVMKINNFQNLLKEATDLNDKLGRRGAWTPTEKATASRINAELVSSYNDVKGLTRFTSNEEAQYDKIVPDLGKVNVTGTNRDILNQMNKSVQTKKDLMYKQLGITPFDQEAAPAPTAPKGPQEGDTGTYKGKPVVFKNGKFQYR